jgi:peptidoglycan-N-acetylglucosamine deacetylase
MLLARLLRKTAVLGWRWPGLVQAQSTEDKNVYLTFDDGPIPDSTPQILAALAEFEATATFFLVGRSIEKHPEIVSEIIAKGHAIANHTYSHQRLCEISHTQAMKEVARNQKLIESFGGMKVFRPPCGLMGIRLFLTLSRQSYRFAYWTLDSRDSFADTTLEISKHLQQNLRPGSIVLFHDDRPTGLAALRPFLAEVKERGLKFAALH